MCLGVNKMANYKTKTFCYLCTKEDSCDMKDSFDSVEIELLKLIPCGCDFEVIYNCNQYDYNGQWGNADN